MIVDKIRAVLARVFHVVLFSIAIVGLTSLPVFAQDDEQDNSGTTQATQGQSTQEEKKNIEEVVVTGSRLKRDTYSSIAPLQVISGQVSREVGLIDPGQILQESTAASGVQVDLTFSGFVLDNGPGATNIDLRGLGASRTLLLINGRRVAPAGVEGAPYSPDTTLLPGALVDRYELLLDGASSVYGSDAVAGVANIILRKDFDGLELEAFSSIPQGQEKNSGIQNRFSASWGYNGDRGFIGIGTEYRQWDRVNLADRAWTNGCDKNLERTTDGEIRTIDRYYSYNFGMRPSPCKVEYLAGRFYEYGTGLGSVYYTPGSSNTGIPNFSDSYLYSVPISYGADGYNTINFTDYDTNGRDLFKTLIPDIKTYSGLAYGEYTLEGEANITPYFEILYAKRESFQDDGAYQLFPDVPANNPYNVCNPNAAGGVDCGLAHDSVLNNPQYRAAFAQYYEGLCASYGYSLAQCTPNLFGLYYGALGPVQTQPIVNVRGDRTLVDVSVDQIRYVAGVKGDLPFLNGVGPLDDWTWDFYAMRSESNGTSSRPGIRGDRLDYALGWYSSTNTPCENDLGVEMASDVAAGCVPVNMFAPSLYNPIVGGDFATPQEHDYLFDTRDFDTKYTQTVYSLYANGDIFELPGGTALFGVGAEYRTDKIESLPDEVARDGLFFGFFSDGGAVGSKFTREFFAELELPLVAGHKGMEELTVNMSGRRTTDEYYGSATTYSGKLAYRPIDSLLLRGTVGTSYRAPNLRENFLQSQTGFLNLFDPCVIPEAAWNDVTNTYDPTQDNREPQVLTNCLANGVDPTTFDNNTISIYSTEVAAGGETNLDEETSKSYSAGFTWDQPFFSSFDLVFGLTYYSINIKNEIIEPSAQFIINDCYNDPQGNSPFCSRIMRDPTTLRFDIVNQGFINRDAKKARGVDVNMSIDIPSTMFGRAVDWGMDFAFNHQIENRDIFVDDDGVRSEDNYAKEFGYPEWKGRVAVRADIGDWRATWSMRYISGVAEDPADVDPYGGLADGSDTCLGTALGGVDCRDVGYANNYFTHDISVYYRGDTWTFGAGVRNLFNEWPPQVDGSEVFAINNTPYGAGYDLFGRQVFMNVVYNLQTQ